ncbi:hypothetical protein BASA81_013822 [Batrachochytrium salamandrivorans]|nr:hypothetical protein BASA81_013822 [Batrachochytrium salamandrivorans]
MASSIPVNLKPITPFVLRGKEVLKGAGEEVVAYHCYKYALELGMRLPKCSEGQAFLLGIMDELERIKPHLAGRSVEDLKITCETFADQVFARADHADRAGEADRTTAQTFYAAASFLEILKQFPGADEDEELAEKILYAKFKATDILKAVKEGRKPAPGPPNADPTPQEETEEAVPVAAPAAKPRPYVPASPVIPNIPVSAGHVSKEAKADALELLRFARAAIEADDYSVGVARLQQALGRLSS